MFPNMSQKYEKFWLVKNDVRRRKKEEDDVRVRTG